MSASARTPRTSTSPCRADTAGTPRRTARVSHACSRRRPRSCLGACRGGTGCTSRSCPSASRAGTASSRRDHPCTIDALAPVVECGGRAKRRRCHVEQRSNNVMESTYALIFCFQTRKPFLSRDGEHQTARDFLEVFACFIGNVLDESRVLTPRISRVRKPSQRDARSPCRTVRRRSSDVCEKRPGRISRYTRSSHGW